MQPLVDATSEATRQIGSIGAVHSLLRAHRLDVDDFAFEEHESGFADLLGGSGRIVAAKCRSTGEERLYASGNGSAWLGAFMLDLESGQFGKLPPAAA